MPPERKYTESEVAQILEQASSSHDVGPAGALSHQGLSLAQIREIAEQVGIDPSRVGQAAVALDRGDTIPTRRRTWLGLPIGVTRTVELGRTLTDDEWDHLVVLLRETFDARGRLHAHGAFRQWTNGNLQALLEPTPNGHRLRISTHKGDTKLRVALGLAGLVGGAVAFSGILSSGLSDVGALLATGTLVAMGALSLASVGFGLPSWARTRAEQMEAIAERTTLAHGEPQP